MKITFCRHQSQPSVPTLDIGTDRRHQLYSSHAPGECSLSFYFPAFSYFSLSLFLFLSVLSLSFSFLVFLSFSFLSFFNCLSSVGTDSLGPTVFRRLSQGTDNQSCSCGQLSDFFSVKITCQNHENYIMSARIATVGADSRHWHQPSAPAI